LLILVGKERFLNLTKLLSGVDPLDPRCPRTLADMLDLDPHHPLRLDLKQRKSGRPPLKPPRKYWGGIIPDPIDINPATLLVRDAKRIRGAKDSGRKVQHKQLQDGISRATYYRRLKMLSAKGNKTADRVKAGSPK
jgi:hypothetical protein